MKKDKILTIIFLILTIVINVFIIFQSVLDANNSTEQSSWVITFLSNTVNFFIPNLINESNIDVFSHGVRKFIGHFSLFAVDGLVTTLFIYYLLKNKLDLIYQYSISLGFGFIIASTTEFIQIFRPGRSGEFKDIMIDFLGYLLLASLIIFINVILKYRKKNQPNVE